MSSDPLLSTDQNPTVVLYSEGAPPRFPSDRDEALSVPYGPVGVGSRRKRPPLLPPRGTPRYTRRTLCTTTTTTTSGRRRPTSVSGPLNEVPPVPGRSSVSGPSGCESGGRTSTLVPPGLSKETKSSSMLLFPLDPLPRRRSRFLYLWDTTGTFVCGPVAGSRFSSSRRGWEGGWVRIASLRVTSLGV